MSSTRDIDNAVGVGDLDGPNDTVDPRSGSAAEVENLELRIMLAIAHAGLSLYTDDGELQDTRCHPWINFKRDSVAEIDRKLRERAYKRRTTK